MPAVAEKSFTLQEKPQKLWDALSTIENWTMLGATRSFKESFQLVYEVLPGQVPGPGMKFRILSAGVPIQDWQIDEWQPPKRFTAATITTYGDYSLMNVEAKMEVVVAAVDSLDTKVDIRFELSFTHPVLGPILNLLFPIRMRMQKVLNNLADRLPKLLEDLAAAGR